MTDRGRRLGKGIAIALAVHIVAAALLGILGYRFTQRPPQILEVTLGGGGEGTGAGTGQGSGEGSGSGTGSGSGSGSGSGAGQGSGSGVPVTPPYLVSSTDPRYPPAARNREIEGTVYVKMLVSSGGSVENAFVARSSGNEALDGAAVEAVYNWSFSPAKDTYGSPVRCYITMPVNFVLH